MKNLKEFENFINEKKVKFTDPQKNIIKNLLQGSKLVVVNQHYASGGDYMWLHDGHSRPSYAGSVYKAFWGAQWSIQKQTGVKVPFGELFFNYEHKFVGQF